jgi:GNAT superfamily N-acetyltransferase
MKNPKGHKIETRPVESKDIDDLLDIQKHCYTDEYIETGETFKGMMGAYPDGSVLATVDGSAAGYIFFHPFFIGKVKDMNLSAVRLTGKEDCIYIHDMCVHPAFRGMGITKLLLGHLNNVTRGTGFSVQALVSVQQSRAFWERQGFAVSRSLTYGGKPAHYMTRILQDSR